MSDFLSRLVQRTISDQPMLIPRQESVFEQAIKYSEPIPGPSVPVFKAEVRPTAPQKIENAPLREEIPDTAAPKEVSSVSEIEVEKPVDHEPQQERDSSKLNTPPIVREKEVDAAASIHSIQPERPFEERGEEDTPIDREPNALPIEKQEAPPEPLIERIPVVVEKESSKPIFITRERRETIREILEARDREPSISIGPPEKTNTPSLSHPAQEEENAADVNPSEVETLEVKVEDSPEKRETRRDIDKSKTHKADTPVSSIRQNETFSAPEFSAHHQSRNARATVQPLIEISIGSIDIKAENSVHKNQIPVRSKPAARLGIDDYLKKRREALK